MDSYGWYLTALVRSAEPHHIVVASLGVLAKNLDDFAEVVRRVLESNLVITSISTGKKLERESSGRVVLRAVREYLQAHTQVRAIATSNAGTLASLEKRQRDVAARLDLMRPDWRRAEISTKELLWRGGRLDLGGHRVPMAYSTAVKHLGRRSPRPGSGVR